MVIRKPKHERQRGHSDLEELDYANDTELVSSNNELTGPEKLTAMQKLRTELNRHIDSLLGVFRTVFVMRGVEQLSVRETAQILDINEITVKTRFSRAKHLLQKEIST